MLVDPTHLTLSGVGLAQVAIAALGVLAVSSEYGTGLIRSTLAAAPRRGGLLMAKALVLGVSTLLVMVPVALAAFLLTRPGLEDVLGVGWPMDATVVRALVGTGVYLAGIALLGLALGTIVRSSAGGITLMFGVLFLLPLLPMALPRTMAEKAAAFLPTSAGSQLMKVPAPDAVLGLGSSAVVFGCYVAVALGVAYVLLRRRDTR
nr:ABC transporter permease subunit [Nocardiopsis mwathae]